MERAGAVYVLAHAAKLGARPFHAWAPLPPDVTVVTDSAATDAQTRPFTDRGVEVVRVSGVRWRLRPRRRVSSDRAVNIGRIAARASGLSENVNIQKDVRRRGNDHE